MRIVTCHNGHLRIDAAIAAASDSAAIAVHLIDGVASSLGLEAGHVHELLAAGCMPRHVAAWISRTLTGGRAVVWCEPSGGPYPPALAAAGLSLAGVYLLRPRNDTEAVWAIAESLRCRGVGMTVAFAGRLTPVQARRLQLAAERGGGRGLLIRSPTDAAVHAARTRWLIRPEPGEAFKQRWRMRRIHGPGRASDEDVLIEVDRETHVVCATAVVADRSREATPAIVAG